MLSNARRRGFTLMEILIVVVILGILSGIIIPSFANATDDARQTAFGSSVRSYAAALDRFRIAQAGYPGDGSTGTLPAGMEQYINPAEFGEITPLGGRWDIEFNDSGITSGVGVHFNGDGATRDDAYMQAVDEIIDNGDLESGRFQRIANGRYYIIVAP